MDNFVRTSVLLFFRIIYTQRLFFRLLLGQIKIFRFFEFYLTLYKFIYVHLFLFSHNFSSSISYSLQPAIQTCKVCPPPSPAYFSTLLPLFWSLLCIVLNNNINVVFLTEKLPSKFNLFSG